MVEGVGLLYYLVTLKHMINHMMLHTTNCSALTEHRFRGNVCVAQPLLIVTRSR